MRRTLSLLLGLLLLAAPAAAQRPLLATTVQTTDTTANSVLVGCAVGSTTCTGGIKAGPVAGSTVTATGVGSFGSVAVTSGVTVGGTLGVTGITTLAAALGGTSATFSGTVTGNLFSGSGASLTSIPETAITNGTLLARVADTETISGAWTFTAGSTIFSANAGVTLGLYRTGATTDEKRWYLRNTASTAFQISTCNDNDSACADALTITRSGAIPQLATFTTAVALSSTLAVTSTTTTAGLTNSAAERWSGVVRPAALANTTLNDYAPAGITTASILSLQAGSVSTTITGIAASQADGRILPVCNINSTGPLLFANNTGSTAANQFTNLGGTLTSTGLASGTCVVFWYDGNISRWRTFARGDS